MKRVYDIIILGAGYGGLTTAAYLANHGFDLCLLEGHSDIGGCAGRFKRKNALFDAGATTLSGIKFSGPIDKLLKDLQINCPLKKADPGIIFQWENEKLRRYSDQQQWITELERVFPHLQHKRVWNEIEKVNRLAWEILPHIKTFPLKDFEDIVSLLSPKTWKALGLAPYLTKTFSQLFDDQTQQDKQHQKFLDEMLLISTQSKADEVNALIGCLGASYPSDTWIPYGGMSAMADQLVEKIKLCGGDVFLKKTVQKIEKNDQLFEITTQTGESFHSKTVVSNIPLWNHEKIGPAEFMPEIKKANRHHPHIWSALSAYTTIKFETPLQGQYFQYHLDADLPYSKGRSLFLSFSLLDDQKRTFEGHQSLTISIHAHENDWSCPRGSEEYKLRKKELALTIETHLRKMFSTNNILEMGKIEIGTPHTFERYTGRFNGRVGGLPHKKLKTLLTYPSFKTSVEGFYRVGDTVFPGQGVVGVISGAQKLSTYLQNKYKKG